ncbi:MAG: haloacid dehalogenase-like hydrolase [Atopobiaceae bacterium]|nr:haloacid dehalogenase-like hydrolase [Atopobiaceae bacterium]
MKDNVSMQGLTRARRALSVVVALIVALCIAGCGANASSGSSSQMSSQTSSSSASSAVTTASLSSWTKDSQSLKKLTDFVSAATDESSKDYIPVEDRIAVFDLDGTLMCETYPWCFEYMVFADYALNNPNYKAPEDIKAVAQEIVDSAWGKKPEKMSTRQAQAGAIAYKGLTPAELEVYVTKFKESKAEGFSGMTRGQAWYKPMVEVFEYLQANDFDVYVVTATERNVVRAVVAGTLNIDPSHVIGTEYGYTATGQGDEADGDYTFKVGDKVVFDGTYAGENAKTCKVDAIAREIGKQPVLAFGNSSGDAAMLNYALSENAHPSAAFMVLADDTEREYGNAEDAAKDRESWEKAGYTVFSMRDDFATIYGDGVKKEPVA